MWLLEVLGARMKNPQGRQALWGSEAQARKGRRRTGAGCEQRLSPPLVPQHRVPVHLQPHALGAEQERRTATPMPRAADDASPWGSRLISSDQTIVAPPLGQAASQPGSPLDSGPTRAARWLKIELASSTFLPTVVACPPSPPAAAAPPGVHLREHQPLPWRT